MAEASLGDTQDNQEIDTQHGTSDQFVNPWCELCILDSKEKIEAVGYCPECNTLLCRSCVDEDGQCFKHTESGAVRKCQNTKPKNR